MALGNKNLYRWEEIDHVKDKLVQTLNLKSKQPESKHPPLHHHPPNWPNL